MNSPANRKITCLLDWDGTLRKGYTILDWTSFLVRHKLFSKHLNNKLSNLISKIDHSIPYERAVNEAAALYAKGIVGTESKRIDMMAVNFVNEDHSSLFRFSEALLKILKESAVKVIIVSGSPIEPLNAYSKLFDFADIFALKICTDSENKFNGDILTNYGLAIEKQNVVNILKQRNERIFLSIGNSESDLPLFKAAENSIVIGDCSKVPNDTKKLSHAEIMPKASFRA